MSLTTPTVHVPDTAVSVPGWVRRHLAWLLVGVALVATAVLFTFTIVDSSSDADVTPHGQLIEQGSIRAVERGASPEPAATNSLLDRSITAIDRSAR